MRKIVILASLLATAGTLFAQQGHEEVDQGFYKERGIDIALGLHVGIPTKDMRKAIRNNMMDMGFGLNFVFVSDPLLWFNKNAPSSPVRLGADVGYTYYGRFLSEITVNGYKGDYKTSYGIGHLNGILRLRPPHHSAIIPYIDGLIGLNVYFSSTKENFSFIESALGLESLAFAGTASASFVKGFGAGFTIGRKDPNKPRINFRATYQAGSSIKYVERNSINYEQGSNRLTYVEGRAPVKYFTAQVAFAL